MFFVEQDRVLFSGDLAMSRIFPAFATPQSRAGSWIASLDSDPGWAQPLRIVAAANAIYAELP